MNKQTFQSRIFPIQVRMELPHAVFPTRVQLMWPYKFRSRRTTGSSMCDQDLGHLCRGRCIHTSGHSNYGIVQQSWSVLRFFLGVSRYCVGRLSCTICGSCGPRVPATLQVFTPEWFLMAQLVDCGILEMCGSTECSRCVVGWVGEEEEVLMEEGAWENNHGWDMRHTRWQHLFWRTKMTMQFLSQAHQLCGARLWTNCTTQMCLVSGCPVYVSSS